METLVGVGTLTDDVALDDDGGGPRGCTVLLFLEMGSERESPVCGARSTSRREAANGNTVRESSDRMARSAERL